MLTFKALHILSMIAMVTIEIGAETLYAFAISRRDIGSLAAVHRVLERLHAGPASVAAFISGVVFGLLTAATGGFDLLDGWLIAAYILVVAFLASTTMFLRGALPLGKAAAEAEGGQAGREALGGRMASSRVLLWFALDLTIVVAFVLDMVLKPF